MYRSPYARISRLAVSATGALLLQVVLNRRGTLLEKVRQLSHGDSSSRLLVDAAHEVAETLSTQVLAEANEHFIDERPGEFLARRQVQPDSGVHEPLDVRSARASNAFATR